MKMSKNINTALFFSSTVYHHYKYISLQICTFVPLFKSYTYNIHTTLIPK